MMHLCRVFSDDFWAWSIGRLHRVEGELLDLIMDVFYSTYYSLHYSYIRTLHFRIQYTVIRKIRRYQKTSTEK